MDYSQLPFTMSVKSMTVTDYSTGKEYVYTDRSGNKESIKAVDGEIFGSPGGSPPEEVESSTPPAEKPEPTPAPTEGMPEPAPSKSLEPPTTLTTEVSVTSLPGLPSSWVISSSDSGTASDPSSAAVSEQPAALLFMLLLIGLADHVSVYLIIGSVVLLGLFS